MTRHKALCSIETPDRRLCVDVFQRLDGSFGFEEYRKDPEDPRGWFAVGGYADLRYETSADTYQAALQRIAWLGRVAGPASDFANQDKSRVGTTA